MKMIYCSSCKSSAPLDVYKVTTCKCGKCLGKYLRPYTVGDAVFTEVGVSQPVNLWVIGITNDFLTDNKPTYKEWKRRKTSMNYKCKSNIVRIRPSKSLLRKVDCRFVKYSKFYAY